MKLSTKGRYGLRALADLALHSEGQPVPLSGIAQRQQISENYLESMFSTLRRAGVVKSVKGAGGGYLLSRDPGEVLVGDVLRVLEGDLAIVESDLADSDVQDRSLKYFIETQVWDQISDKINRTVDGLTLADLMAQDVSESAQKKENNDERTKAGV